LIWAFVNRLKLTHICLQNLHFDLIFGDTFQKYQRESSLLFLFLIAVSVHIIDELNETAHPNFRENAKSRNELRKACDHGNGRTDLEKLNYNCFTELYGNSRNFYLQLRTEQDHIETRLFENRFPVSVMTH
jgi:hypothetical protein